MIYKRKNIISDPFIHTREKNSKGEWIFAITKIAIILLIDLKFYFPQPPHRDQAK